MTNSLLSYFIDNALTFLLTAPIVIIALTMHEASHAFVAYKLGDPTAKRYGGLR